MSSRRTRPEAPLPTLRLAPVLTFAIGLLAALGPAPASAAPPPGAVPIATGVVPEPSRAPLRARTPLQGPDDAPFLTADGLRTLAAWGLERIVLQNPGRTLENADGWDSRAVFHWLRDVRACQPAFVPEAERYHDYYAYEDCPTPEDDRLTAFVVARLPRDPASVKQMWDLAGEPALAALSADRYVSSGARDTVDLLRRAYHRVVDGRNDAALTALYGGVAAEGCRALDRALLGQEAGSLDCWAATFWLRRHHEGNVAVIAGILDGIAAKYTPAPPPGAWYVQGIGVRLRARPSADADALAVLPIGAPCARRPGDAPGWSAVRCLGRDGFVSGALLGATPPDADALEASARDTARSAEDRLQAALRASALHPDHAYPAGLVIGAFRGVELARIEALSRAGAATKRERRVPCPLYDDPRDPEAWHAAMRESQAWQCVSADLGRGGEWYVTFGAYEQPWFVSVAARDGQLAVTSGRVTLQTDGPSQYAVLYEGTLGGADTVLAERLREVADGPVATR